MNTTRFTWKQAPDLMARLTVAQNSIKAPIDIITFAAFCKSRDELQRHVEHYEARAISDNQPKRRRAA